MSMRVDLKAKLTVTQNVNVLVEWELQDQNDDDIWCFEEPAKT